MKGEERGNNCSIQKLNLLQSNQSSEVSTLFKVV